MPSEGRVYLEVPPNTDLVKLAPWKTFLNEKGFSMRSHGVVSDLDDAELRVQFYLPGDQGKADQLLAELRKTIKDPKVAAKAKTQLVTGISGARPGHFDIRLGPDTVKALSSLLPTPRLSPDTPEPP